MKREKAIVITEPKGMDKEAIKEVLLKIVEENIRTYLSKNSFSNDLKKLEELYG